MKTMRGFTLIELMIVVVVVSILVAIAYPSYQEYADRAKRADGKNLLLDMASRQERYYFDNNSYTTDPTELGYGADPAVSPEGHYSVSITNQPTGDITTGYTLTASPVAPFNDPKCGNLVLNSRNQQSCTGSICPNDGSTPPDRCW